MADLSVAAHPGSGHLPGHVLGNSQAVPMFACNVGTISMNVVSLSYPIEASYFFRLRDHRKAGLKPASLAPYTLH